MGSFATIFCIFVYVVVEIMYAFKTGSFGKKSFVFIFMLMLLYRICTHVILVVLATSLFVYV